MDVKCERCNTEYEFDDALVSGRGTTVKCTNCGHKFKIRRSDGDFSEDFWNVTTGDGRTLVFTSLRELQRAIQGYLVERNDRLSRGGLPQKPIGQIPELAPFFEQREAAKKQQAAGRTVKTQDGLGPAAANIAANAGPPPQPAVRPRQPTKPEFPAPPADERVRPSDPNVGKTTLIGTGFAEPDPAAAAAEAAPKTERQPPVPAAGSPFDGTSTAPMAHPSPPSLAGGPVTPAPVAARPRESTNTAPMMRPTPAPSAPIAAAAPAAPPVSQPPATPAMARTAAVSNPPPLPDRARRSGAPEGGSRSSARIPAASPPAPAPAPPPPALPRERARPSSSSGDVNGDARSSDRMVAASAPVSSPELSSPLPPEPRVRSLLSEIEEDRDRVRGPYGSNPDGPPSRRRSVGGFIVATVFVGCLLLLGAVWAQRNLGVTLGTKTPPPVATVDPRVGGFLTSGEKALADGNIDLAKESFDKASALAEKDPHVLLDLARLAAVRADVLWLKSRLLPSDAADEHKMTREGLVELSAGARKAAEDAVAAAPESGAAPAFRAKIDALRISGDRDGARALVGKITSTASTPESAYVLAALDLAEVEPLWPTVLERLKTAAAAETGPGRARAALVYALVRAGDPTAAKAEVERLASMTKPHPLLSLLRAYADRAKVPAKVDAGAPEIASAAAVDAGKVPRPGTGTSPPPTRAGVGASSGSGLPGDSRELVSQGERARAKGDYDRARTLFNAAVDKNPSDSEALAGLAAIAYSQRDLAGARTAYKRVLAMNPNYLPAQIGLADVEWDSGDKATATRLYKDITDRYPEGTYPARVKQRSEGGGG